MSTQCRHKASSRADLQVCHAAGSAVTADVAKGRPYIGVVRRRLQLHPRKSIIGFPRSASCPQELLCGFSIWVLPCEEFLPALRTSAADTSSSSEPDSGR